MLKQSLEEILGLDLKLNALQERIRDRMSPHQDLIRRLSTIPGVKETTAWRLIAELGTARYADVDLVQTWESWSIAEIRDLGQAAADHDLRRDDTAILQPYAVDFQHLSRNAGIAGRNDSGGPCVEDRALTTPVA